MTTSDMQNTHTREAKSPLLFCTAQNYVQSNEAEQHGLAGTFRPTDHERNTDMSIKSITHWFEGWKRYRAAVRELSLLTDRELSDLGIQRTEIDLVARQSLHI